MTSSAHAATLREIWIYPIKSARGIPLTSAQVEGAGLAFDRRWMVVDPRGQFMTARKTPALLRVEPTLTDDALVLTWRGENALPPLSIPLQPSPDGLVSRDVQIWSMTCAALDLGDAIADWLTRALGTPSRLVWMPTPRAVRADFADVGNGEMTFADTLPCLVASTASLDDLNQRMDAPLPMSRFRPNLVVDGCPAFDEDLWASFSIGDAAAAEAVSFAGVKLCDRCVLTTIDPATGAKGKEPLATLATFREHGQRVFFGQNAVPQGVGTIAVGQPVFVHRRAVLISFDS